MADGQDPSLVQDGFYDIAKRSSNEQMRISATGRRKFQFCYLVSSAMSKSSNVQYDATTDCLTDPAKLPTGKELEMTDLTKRYLEVGLIHGQEPAKYIATGAGRNKERELEKEKRGVLDRDQHAMRVFTPVTTKLKAQCKFYVGCAPVDGRLSPKLIRADRVYFYPEFWQAIGAKTTPSCKRLAALWKACREHAVEEEEKIPRVLIVADNESKTRTAHPSVTTASGQLASICILHYASFQETGNARHIADLRKTLKDPVGRAGFGPDTNTEGVLSLLDLSQPFSEEVALKAQNELAIHAGIHADADFLAYLHRILKSLGPDFISVLNSRTLGFFLPYYKEMEGSKATEEGVRRTIRTTVIHSQAAKPISMKSNVTYNGEKGEMKVRDFHHALFCIDQVLLMLQDYSKRSTVAVAEQHGGILRHESVGELMSKIATAADTATIQGLVSELAALDSMTIQRALNETVQELSGEVRHYIAVLMSRSKQDGDEDQD